MSYEIFVERDLAEAAGSDLYTRIQMLAGDLIDDNDKKRATKRHHQLVGQYAQYAKRAMGYIDALGLDKPNPKIVEALVPGSFCLTFKLRLARPLLSKDDEPFHICDNPMRKDPVFRVPMMSPSGWKGCIRSAATRLLAEQADNLTDPDFADARLRLTALFGNERGVDAKESDRSRWQEYLDKAGGLEAAGLYRAMLKERSATGFLAGRLRFFPTFFDNLGIEVINPHDRTKKAGKLPIYFECVPDGATGTFTLLYVPFDLVGQSEPELRHRVSDDLEMLAPALRAMLSLYGFGAKTSSGYGVIDEQFVEQKGAFKMNFEEPSAAAAQPMPSQAPQMSDEVRDFLSQYPGEDFSLKVQAWRRKHKAGKGPARKYRYAKDVFYRYQQELDRYQAEQATQPVKAEVPSACTSYTFETLDELKTMMMNLASTLRREVEHE
jgi:CRISPR-associated protein Cmr2